MEDPDTFAKAFVDLYDGIDGAVDDLSDRDFSLTQEFWPLYVYAREHLRKKGKQD